MVSGLVTASVICVMGLTGCVNGSAESSTSTEAGSNDQLQESYSTESSSLNEENNNSEAVSLDFEQVASNIVLNGENIKLPTTLRELGEGYSLGERTYELQSDKSVPDFEYNGYMFNWYSLMYNSEEIGSVCIMSDNNKKAEDLTICGIQSEMNLSIDGISIDSDVSEMLAKWGKPSYQLELRTQGNKYKYEKKPDCISVFTKREDKDVIGRVMFGYFTFLDD